MTCRQSDSSSKDMYSKPLSRLNQQIRPDSTDEGCPVMEESGTVCGETNSLCIFQEFRQMYDDCLKKLEGTQDGSATLRKLAPFKKLIDDLWEQNTMLVETVEELEQEATCKVTKLQDRLNKSCQKELHCMLKAKEREVECLMAKVSEKDELLKKYCCQVEDLKKDLKNKCKKYREILKQLKEVRNEGNKICEEELEKELCDSDDIGELLSAIVKNVEEQRKSVVYQLQNAESQIKSLAAENKIYLKERNEIATQLQCIRSEKDKLQKEITGQKKSDFDKDELIKTVEVLKSEKKDLLEKVNTLRENIQELNNNFKETRRALTSEVAEKHDQVQDLKRCVGVLEEQLRQADMQTHFKDDIIKELRKELKVSRKSERRGLYDVVSELRERNSECASKAKFSKSNDLIKYQSGETSSDIIYHSTTSVPDRQNTNDDKVNTNEKEKLLSQIDCLKKNFKLKMEELKVQEEITKNLEEELSRTKMDLASLQEKYEEQESRCISGESSTSESNLRIHRAALICAANKIEETLRNLLLKRSCALSNIKILEAEMGKICLIKNNLEKNKSKSQMSRCSEKTFENSLPCSSSGIKCHFQSSFSNQSNVVHIEDLEKFREMSITAVVALEKMKEQINILENLVKKYTKDFPCGCDKKLIEESEDKLNNLRTEFDKVTEQLCHMLQKLNKSSSGGNYDSFSFESTFTPEDGGSVNSQNICSLEELNKLKTDYQKFQKLICDQENATERLKKLSKQLEEEIQQKRDQLIEHTREIDAKMCEISKLREVIRKVCRRLKEAQFDHTVSLNQEGDSSPGKNVSNLSGLFCDLQEFWCVLEKSVTTLFDAPKKLIEDNNTLKEQVGCLEKRVCNKEETIRLLQDTVKLKKCQIEELKSKMQSTERQNSQLAQDVEEKCRLIANLQEAIRKYKQFEVYIELVESLRFEYCELECKLEKYEKEVLLKDQKLESLQSEIAELSSRNFVLNEKIKIMDPKLKIMYKTCHLFEKTVNDLQEKLNDRECETESLYEKIKEMELELEREFKKCEDRAAEDSKCIEELSLTVKNFQNDFYCAQENYKKTIKETECKLKKELEKRETELNNTICQLESEVKKLKNQIKENACKNDSANSKVSTLESIIKQAECQQEEYQKRIEELQKSLECITEEYEKEKKNIIQKLCDEKKENLKNKDLITSLNENIKRKMLQEKSLKECIDRYTEDIESLKAENQDLKSEVEARKKIMCAMEKGEGTDLQDLEKLICSFKIQKAELRARNYNLEAEVDKEIKLKRLLECRVEDLNAMLQDQILKFNQMAENYKCTSLRIQQTYSTMKDVEEKLICSLNSTTSNQSEDKNEECNCLKKILGIKTAENSKLVCQIQVIKAEMETMQNENAAEIASKEVIISCMQHEIESLENDLQEFQIKCRKLMEENKKLHCELESCVSKETTMQNEFREKQKELCEKLKATICERNDLLDSLEEMQKQLERICLENVNKEKRNRELTEECSRLKTNVNSNENFLKNKSDKIICNLGKEVKNLHCELSEIKENFQTLNEEYHAVLERLKCCEKKKCNIEKLYLEVNNENKVLLEAKEKFEKELCELKAQNSLLKDKLTSNTGKEGSKHLEEKKKLCEKIKELSAKLRLLEKKVIPELKKEITEKICCIENLKFELREANISNQRMRNEGLKVIQHTRKYLAAQKCANNALRTRLECSSKRGNMLGIENRELEDHLKAIARMNELLLCQLDSTKNFSDEVEPRPFSPLPWGCSTVERDTSSSEYLAESGFQSMQPSPTNLEYTHESPCDTKRNNQRSSTKKYKYEGSIECPSHRSGVR